MRLILREETLVVELDNWDRLLAFYFSNIKIPLASIVSGTYESRIYLKSLLLVSKCPLDVLDFKWNQWRVGTHLPGVILRGDFEVTYLNDILDTQEPCER